MSDQEKRKPHRCKLITIRASEEEFANFQRYCDDRKIDMSTAVRSAFCGVPKPRRNTRATVSDAEIAKLTHTANLALNEMVRMRTVLEMEGSEQYRAMLDDQAKEWREVAAGALQVLLLP